MNTEMTPETNNQPQRASHSTRGGAQNNTEKHRGTQRATNGHREQERHRVAQHHTKSHRGAQRAANRHRDGTRK